MLPVGYSTSKLAQYCRGCKDLNNSMAYLMTRLHRYEDSGKECGGVKGPK